VTIGRTGSDAHAWVDLDYSGLIAEGARLHERGLSVPAEVSVLAVASRRIATTVQPQVSAADVPAEQMGRHAVEALLRLIASPSAPLAHILLSPPFEDRGSIALARTSGAVEPLPL
jgi:DNA-binding LacI/PurR family transcriptional regulator